MIENDVYTQEQKIEELLKGFDEHRNAITNMIDDLEKIRAKVDKLLPDSVDARFMRFFEEKVKAVTGLFTSLLEMRKEIAKSIKDEIEIRRRMKDQDSNLDVEEFIDVRELAKKVEEFKQEKDKHQKLRIEKNKNKTITDGINIPGITSQIEGKTV